jgi:hypothetical protein
LKAIHLGALLSLIEYESRQLIQSSSKRTMLYGVFPGGVSFNAQKDIPPLNGKVIFVTGGVSAF